MAARIEVPKQARRGEVIAIRVVVQHVMETGYRRDHFGRAIPKNVIHTFVARYNGAEIFRAELGSGIAANPYLQFFARAEASGEVEFAWTDDAGERGAARAAIVVIG